MVRSTIFSQLEKAMCGVQAEWMCTLYILALVISFALGIRKQNGCHYSSASHMPKTVITVPLCIYPPQFLSSYSIVWQCLLVDLLYYG